MMTQPYFQHQPQYITIGTIPLLVEEKEFIGGFDSGYDSYHTYHQCGEVIETSTLLFLIKNGWNGDHSDMWTTGYIMGWLAAFYEQEDGQLALCVPLTGHHEGVA